MRDLRAFAILVVCLGTPHLVTCPAWAKQVEVCIPDAAKAAEALAAAIKYQSKISVRGANLKRLGAKAMERAEWCERSGDCVADFKANAERYVSSFKDSALILYARDWEDPDISQEDPQAGAASMRACAFLFAPGQPMQYAWRQIRGEAFEDGIERIRAVNVRPGGRSVAGDRQRALEALRNGSCGGPGSAPASQPTPIEARVGPYEPASERAIADVLFPDEFRETLDRVKHLSIIPFGSITTLPIGILRPFSEDLQVVDRFTINYLLFAGDVARPIAQWSGPPTEPLIFGNPVSLDKKRQRCIPPLPNAESEAKLVNTLFGGTYLGGEQATLKAFEQSAAKADMIYFAAHGLAGFKDGISDSIIVLADSNLSASDVQLYSRFQYDKTRLVVMSACQTGLGRISEFGVIGLARTFLDAGAQNAVMSLWNVSDSATFALMSEFNRGLKTMPPAEALQAAQQHLRKKTDYKAPEYWAGFSVYGSQMTTKDPSPSADQ